MRREGQSAGQILRSAQPNISISKESTEVSEKNKCEPGCPGSCKGRFVKVIG